jgi:hypothetical protein
MNTLDFVNQPSLRDDITRASAPREALLPARAARQKGEMKETR